jgi:hypothetical protein
MIYGHFVDGRCESAGNDDTIAELPSGAVELTEEQFADRFNLKLVDGRLINSPSEPVPLSADSLKQMLDLLERKDTSFRAVREILLQVLIYFGSTQGASPAKLYAENPAFKGLKDLDTAASAIRSQIRALV